MDKSNEIKEEFLKLYSDLAENVSKSSFNPVFIEGKVIENFDDILENFKKELSEILTSRFEFMWKKGCVDRNLSALETIKQQSSSLNENECWRPSGKSVSEILRPHRMEILKTKIAFYQEQLEAISPKLEECVCEVENKRAELENELRNRNEFADKVNDMIYAITKTDLGRVDN